MKDFMWKMLEGLAAAALGVAAGVTTIGLLMMYMFVMNAFLDSILK